MWCNLSLRKLQLYFLEARYEKYVILYIGKILSGLVHNFSVKSYRNTRSGHYLIIPKIPSTLSKFRTKYCNKLEIKCSHVVKALPQMLRNLRKWEANIFKKDLDISSPQYQRSQQTGMKYRQRQPNLTPLYTKYDFIPSVGTNGWDKCTFKSSNRLKKS